MTQTRRQRFADWLYGAVLHRLYGDCLCGRRAEKSPGYCRIEAAIAVVGGNYDLARIMWAEAKR